jgi:hypothetical protein
MTRDNAVAEAFNSTLEWEFLHDNHFQTREQVPFHHRHAQPHRLRTHLRSAASPDTTHQTRRGNGGTNQIEAASPPLSSPPRAAPGQEAVPPASRVAARRWAGAWPLQARPRGAQRRSILS